MGMPGVVAQARPAGETDRQAFESFRLEFAERRGALIESSEFGIVAWVFGLGVAGAVRLDVRENAGSNHRCSNQLFHHRCSGNFLLERNEETRIHCIATVAFGESDIISLRKETHASRAGVTQLAQAGPPAWTHHRRSPAPLTKLSGSLIPSFH